MPSFRHIIFHHMPVGRLQLFIPSTKHDNIRRTSTAFQTFKLLDKKIGSVNNWWPSVCMWNGLFSGNTIYLCFYLCIRVFTSGCYGKPAQQIILFPTLCPCPPISRQEFWFFLEILISMDSYISSPWCAANSHWHQVLT